jgi:hypothetical protein
MVQLSLLSFGLSDVRYATVIQQMRHSCQQHADLNML